MGYREGKGDSMASERVGKGWRMRWMNRILPLLVFIGIPSFVHANISDILLKFYPYATVQGEYSNNIFLSPHATKLADYIITGTLGVKFSALQAGTYGIDLDVNGGYTYYTKYEDYNYWQANARLDSWYALTPRLTFRLADYFIRSDAARENVYNATGPSQYYVSAIREQQAIYNRNVFEPSIEYRFGTENLVSLLYRNNLYMNENPQYEDSMENTLNPRLSYWFDIQNGVSLDYYLSYNTYEDSPDQWVNGVTPRYTHRFSPRTSVFGEYRFEYQDFKSPGIDYYIHNPSLGIQYQFSPTLTGLAQGGYWWQVPKEGSKEQGPFFILSLTQRTERTFYTISVQGGYTEDYITAENRGFTETYSGYATIQHQLTQRLSIGLTGYVGSNQYAGDEKEWQYDVRVAPSYLLFRWLTVSMEASYRQNYSNIPTNDYTEFRGLLRITLARPGFQPAIRGGRPAYR
jgi:hypothetical protein